jgi:peptidoglycan/LPS O-acetylase OafA/YrhL
MTSTQTENDNHHPRPANSELHLTHPKYRADIDGLRAVAVLAVVGFHAFPNWVKGGLVGVDIFFVISGFLISTIIFDSLERNSFSFLEFYSRRIRRIFPALLLVLIASFSFGWFWLFADEYKQLGKHIAAGAGFVSNFVLWNEIGYFDITADTKPLLHLWSLGIEEQFYIVWPLLLWAAWKTRVNLLTITLLVAIVSFALNINGIGKDAVATFYSPQTRIWELLAGSTLAWITLYKQTTFFKVKHRLYQWIGVVVYAQASEANGKMLRNVQSVFGVLLIGISFLVVTKGKSFPGWLAVLPTLGAVLIISAGTNAWANRTLLSNRVLVWFGLISYPLYLWHWPLLSFARIVESQSPSQEIRIVIVCISILLAWLTYRFIEKPVRFRLQGKSRTVILASLMVMIGCIGYNTYDRGGLPFRMQSESEFLGYFENERPEMRYFQKINLFTLWKDECAFFDVDKYRAGKLAGVTDSKPREALASSCFERNLTYDKAVLLWGDSNAQVLSPGLQKNLPSNWQLLQIATSGCSPKLDSITPSTTSQCKQSNYFAIKTISDIKPDVVVVAQGEGQSTKSFQDIANHLKTLGVKRVILLGPVPHWKSDLPKLLLRSRNYMPRRIVDGLRTDILELNSILARELKSDSSQKFANVIDTFCNTDGCLTYFGDDAKSGITTWDYGHLTPLASDFLSKRLLVNLIVDKE